MTKIKSGDAAACRRLFDLLIKCQSFKYGNQNPLGTPDVICMILAKTSKYLQDRWNEGPDERARVNWSDKLHCEWDGSGKQSSFSREPVSQYENKPLKQQGRSTKHKFLTHVIKERGDSGKRDKAKCTVCDDHHDIAECQVFLSETMLDRSRTLHKKKLCYGCFGNISKEHNAKSCVNRRKCKVCSGRHPTVLHSLKLQKCKKKGNNEDTKTKENKPEEIKFATTNTGSDVISMCIVPVQIKIKGYQQNSSHLCAPE